MKKEEPTGYEARWKLWLGRQRIDEWSEWTPIGEKGYRVATRSPHPLREVRIVPSTETASQ
jgi:hypothetical protein